jgi:hypothetical protein
MLSYFRELLPNRSFERAPLKVAPLNSCVYACGVFFRVNCESSPKTHFSREKVGNGAAGRDARLDERTRPLYSNGKIFYGRITIG